MDIFSPYIFGAGTEGILGRQEKKITSYVRSYEAKLWQTTCNMYTNGHAFLDQSSFKRTHVCACVWVGERESEFRMK